METAIIVIGALNALLLMLIYARQKNCDEQKEKAVLDAERRLDNLWRAAIEKHFVLFRQALEQGRENSINSRRGSNESRKDS